MHAVQTRNALKGLRPLLEGWIKAVDDYCRAVRFCDNPWWFNERANLSVLAGAAWRLPGWLALEEFATIKRGVVPGKTLETGKVSRGRCDLHVSNGLTQYGFEAKQLWQSAGTRAGASQLPRAARAASDAAGNLMAFQADKRVAAVFIVPWLPLSEVSTGRVRGKWRPDPAATYERIQTWYRTLPLEKFDAHAAYFSPRSTDFVNHTYERIFPGVVLTLQYRQRGTRATKTPA